MVGSLYLLEAGKSISYDYTTVAGLGWLHRPGARGWPIHDWLSRVNSCVFSCLVYLLSVAYLVFIENLKAHRQSLFFTPWIFIVFIIIIIVKECYIFFPLHFILCLLFLVFCHCLRKSFFRRIGWRISFDLREFRMMMFPF